MAFQLATVLARSFSFDPNPISLLWLVLPLCSCFPWKPDCFLLEYQTSLLQLLPANAIILSPGLASMVCNYPNPPFQLFDLLNYFSDHRLYDPEMVYLAWVLILNKYWETWWLIRVTVTVMITTTINSQPSLRNIFSVQNAWQKTQASNANVYRCYDKDYNGMHGESVCTSFHWYAAQLHCLISSWQSVFRPITSLVLCQK